MQDLIFYYRLDLTNYSYVIITRMQMVENSSPLMELPNEIWGSIAHQLGPLYKDSLRRTSKTFHVIAQMIPSPSKRPRYTRDESCLSLTFMRWARDNGCPLNILTCAYAATEGLLRGAEPLVLTPPKEEIARPLAGENA
jgi:hypothetical protein